MNSVCATILLINNDIAKILDQYILDIIYKF